MLSYVLSRKWILRGALTNGHEWIFLIFYLNENGIGGDICNITYNQDTNNLKSVLSVQNRFWSLQEITFPPREGPLGVSVRRYWSLSG